MIGLLRLLTTPLMLIICSFILGLTLFTIPFRRRLVKKAGFCLMALSILVLYLLSISPISNLLAYSLEGKYGMPSKKALAGLDAIVILGGGSLSAGGLREHPEASGVTYLRLFNGVKIFKRSGAKTLILSGRTPGSSGGVDAEVMRDLAVKFGISENRIVVDTISQSTIEQAKEVAKLLPPEEKKHIGIVTSAMHMPRSEMAFRNEFLNDSLVPIPVDYTYRLPGRGLNIENFIPAIDNFCQSSCAIHELIGIIWYSMRKEA